MIFEDTINQNFLEIHLYFYFYLQMEPSSQLLSNPNSIDNQSSVTNSTAVAITSLVYVFAPADFSIKLVLVVLFAIFGVIGLVGNILILYFLSKKKSVPFLQASLFLRNFNLYMRSLALSDILSSLIKGVVICIEIMYDVFQKGWPCKISRCIGGTFYLITVNNLIVISTEKFLSTRGVPKTFSGSTVRKLVYAAWLSGFFVGLFPAATLKGVRHDINATHYTMVCKPDTSYLPTRVIIVGFALIQLVIPSIALICMNIIIARRIWKGSKKRIDIQRDNAIRARMRSHQIKKTSLLITVTIAFVIPYSSILYYTAFVAVAKPSLDFQEDFVIRHFCWVLVFSSSAINFIIYLVQMKDFHVFLLKHFLGKGDGSAQVNPRVE